MFRSYSHPNIHPSEAFANVPYLTQSCFQPCSHITKCSESDSFPPKDLVSIQPYFSIAYLSQSNGAHQTYNLKTYNLKTHGLLATSGLASSPGHSPPKSGGVAWGQGYFWIDCTPLRFRLINSGRPPLPSRDPLPEDRQSELKTDETARREEGKDSAAERQMNQFPQKTATREQVNIPMSSWFLLIYGFMVLSSINMHVLYLGQLTKVNSYKYTWGLT